MTELEYEKNKTEKNAYTTFSIVIYRCDDRYCTECINYDSETETGICT